jgi:hypothetical protein
LRQQLRDKRDDLNKELDRDEARYMKGLDIKERNKDRLLEETRKLRELE